MQPPEPLKIRVEAFPFLNISLHLNNIKPVRSLTIENLAATDTAPVEIKLTCDIPCFEPFHYLTVIPAGKEIRIPLDGLRARREFFYTLSETEKALILVEVLEKDVTLVKETLELNIHPLEYFGGFQILPELIAAYITPNHPYIYYLKRKAIDILEREGLMTAFEGYQGDDPERVLQLMSALYSAIQDENIIYSSLPPGYEETGQRLRLLSTIRQEKFANCIDMSLLFAACLEAADLNPILIVVKGHAFAACWLRDDKFAEVVSDDKSAITKRLSRGIREIAAVEATSMCRGKNIRFTDAVNMGEAQLIQNEDFLLSVDVKRARTALIRPLPLLTDVSEGDILDDEAVQKYEVANMERQFEIGTIYQDELSQKSQRATKQKIWERKLLDLSLRNNLLNLRITRNMLQLIDIDISHLEDTLSEGKSFSIVPDPRAEVLRKYNLFFMPLHHSSPVYQMANDELKYNRLLTHYHQQDLDSILTYIHKNAKLAIEENGSSTLYLAVGLLKWYDRKTPDQPRYAPILLLPVEISRRSVNSKFILKSSGEETMINITLVEFLRQEYELNLSALEQLPYDDKGVDVSKIMGILRRAVMQLKGWDVQEQLVLGNFSFSKLILWKDIVVHQEDLQKSPMVRSLVEGQLTLVSNEELPGMHDLDAMASASLTLPIPTDVSQMEAVLAAQKGLSFILHGPPGTGKSQTITNIIADALYKGKRVLFVAAKKAALDVVHRRLEQIGLAPFTLELHSNKSKKSDVLEQLSKSIETGRVIRSKDFNLESQRLDAAKQAISEYVNLLHKKQPAGWSLYESIVALESYKGDEFIKTTLPDAVYKILDESLFQQWVDWLPQFQSITQLIVHPTKNPLASLQLGQYTPSLYDTISENIQKHLTVLSGLQTTVAELLSEISFPYPVESHKELEVFGQLMSEIKNLPDLPLSLCLFLSDKENFKDFENWREQFNRYLSLRNGLLTNYHRAVLNSDLSAHELQWRQANQAWFIPKWLTIRKVRKQLSVYRSVPFSGDEDIEALFAGKNKLSEQQGILVKDQFLGVQSALKSLFREEETDLAEIDHKVSTLKRIGDIVNHWEYSAMSNWMESLHGRGLQYTDEIKSQHEKQINHFLDRFRQLNDSKDKSGIFTKILALQAPRYLESTIERLKDIQAYLPGLKDWFNYVSVCRQGESLNLHWLLEAYQKKRYDPQKASEYFYHTVHATLVRNVIAQHESLNLFNAELFESKIHHYRRIARDYQNLTIQELRIKLAEQLPNPSLGTVQSSEIGILQRAIKNRGRGMSIRRLFDQIPTLLPRIAPCMLMSPISVAQYFDVNTDHFDIVIFDEASQLPTCESVSSLARAKQAIIVGDPKQMPPTSFFSTIKLDEENMDVEDLESILDDCLSLSVPSKYLLRHYRSKHESLIAFSNLNYYDNKLLTFPSADDLNQKVKYHHIPGHYDKGKTRTNKFEADAIIRYVKAHYSKEQGKKKSLGVVTFSQTQQNLVEDKLQELFISDPKLEQYANESEEPLFVKNLENVQGDERDIILFSVGYAPDEEGKMSMNFGPLNRNGGWRRLNVAVTRARYEMHIFATLRSDQIDLSRTAAEGVAGLKEFLRFAEKGHLNFRPDNSQIKQTRKQLSDAIANRLGEKGLEVKCDIGTSGFKIDVGIVHPDYPQRYILGVIVDGHYYFNASTANDREMVMPAVLNVLGWNIHRVWTMDWYENTEKILEAIVQKVRELQSVNQEAAPPVSGEDNSEASLETSSPVLQEVSLTTEIATKQKSYVAHVLTPVVGGNSEMVYDFQNRNLIRQQISAVVETEAPISKSILYRRVLSAWNTSRAGSKLDQHLEGIINELNLHKTVHHQPFFWNTDEFTIDFYRNNDGEEKRNMEDIAPEELKVAITEVVEQYLSIEKEELLRHIAKVFGFSKVGRQIDTLLRYAIDLLVKDGVLKVEGGRVKLV